MARCCGGRALRLSRKCRPGSPACTARCASIPSSTAALRSGRGSCSGSIAAAPAAGSRSGSPPPTARRPSPICANASRRPRSISRCCATSRCSASRSAAIEALTYVVDRGHPQYAGKLSLDQRIHLIRQGHGRSGPQPGIRAGDGCRAGATRLPRCGTACAGGAAEGRGMTRSSRRRRWIPLIGPDDERTLPSPSPPVPRSWLSIASCSRSKKI